MRRRASHRAFTLLELMLAAVMVAILGVSLAAAMHVGFRARDSARAQVGQMRRAAIAMELAQQDLQSVTRSGGVLAGAFVGRGTADVDGQTAALEFFALGRDADADESPLGEGVRRVELLLRTDADPPALVRRVERNLLAPVREAGVEETLALGVSAFVVRFFDGADWLEEWDSTVQGGELPLAVELTIELSPPDDRALPYRLTQVVPIAGAVPTGAAGGSLE